MRRIPFCSVALLLLFASDLALAWQTWQYRLDHEPGRPYCLSQGSFGQTFYYDDGVQELNEFLKGCDPKKSVMLKLGPHFGPSDGSSGPHRCTWVERTSPNVSDIDLLKLSSDPLLDGADITIYVDEDIIPMTELKIPDGMEVFGAADLWCRAVIGLENDNSEVQARNALRLVGYDPYNVANIYYLVHLMGGSEDQHVRTSTAQALGHMGTYAKDALPTLEWFATNDKPNEQAYKEAIDKIVNGPDVSEKAKAHREAVHSIQTYIRTIRPNQYLDADELRKKPMPTN